MQSKEERRRDGKGEREESEESERVCVRREKDYLPI